MCPGAQLQLCLGGCCSTHAHNLQSTQKHTLEHRGGGKISSGDNIARDNFALNSPKLKCHTPKCLLVVAIRSISPMGDKTCHNGIPKWEE